MTDRPSWQLVDHTGDTGILVRAPSLVALHEEAARALFEILLDPSTVRPETDFAIHVEGEDREDLLVRWLAELHFLHDARRLCFREFAVEQLEERRLQGRARGEAYDPARHVLRTALKAVTYHALLLSEDRSGPDGSPCWTARVIFDV